MTFPPPGLVGPPGFHGKVPSRGDFISRRVPVGLVGPLDEWLSRFTLAVRGAAGRDWPEAWLTAPLWHFALGPGLAPEPGAAGVMVGSVDQVGRMFPFMIVGAAEGMPGEAWTGAVEALILGALEDGFEPDALDDALVRLGAPERGPAMVAGQSVWRTSGSDRVAPMVRPFDGWPDQSAAVAMVLGDTITGLPDSGTP
jgi:type VI secretion system protein ImpM